VRLRTSSNNTSLILKSAAQVCYFTYRKLKHSYLGDTSPVVASIKVTQRCNLSCSHCTWVNKVKNDLTLERWKEIIDTLYKRGCGIVFVEGGEPTLRTDLAQIVSYIKSKGMFCVMFTNGAGKLDDLKTDAVWFSVDGTEKSHDTIRGKGSYRRVLESIDKYPNKRTLSITTLSKVNAGEIENICKELSTTSLDGLIFNFMYPYKDVGDNAMSTKERIACAEEILALKADYPKIASSDAYLSSVGSPNKVCYPWLLLLVTADGTITHGCTVEPMEERNCEVCDMMCGLEATQGYMLDKGSIEFWNISGIMPQAASFPDWALGLLRR